MTAQEVFLQGEDVVRLDPLVRQLAEASVDAVDRLTALQQSHDDPPGAFYFLAGGGREADRFDLTVQHPLGVGEGQAVAAKLQRGPDGEGASHGGIIGRACRRRARNEGLDSRNYDISLLWIIIYVD